VKQISGDLTNTHAHNVRCLESSKTSPRSTLNPYPTNVDYRVSS